MGVFGNINRSLTILMVYLHQYSYINLSILSILYYFYIGMGIQIIFQYSSMFQQDNFYQASKQYLGGQIMLQMSNYQSINKSFFIQLIPIISFSGMYTILNFVKYFFAHPKSIVVRIGISVIEVGTFVLLFVFSTAFVINIFDYVIDIIGNNGTISVLEKIVNVILLIVNTLIQSFFVWKYSICYQEFSYNKLYMFRTETYFKMQIFYLITSTVLRYLFYTEIVLLQTYTILFHIILIIYISVQRIFSFTYQSLYLYCLVVFIAFICIMNALISIFDYIDPDTVNSDLLFMLGITFSVIAAFLCTIIQRQLFKINIIQDLPLKKVKNRYQQSKIAKQIVDFFKSIKTHSQKFFNKINSKISKLSKKELKCLKCKKTNCLPIKTKKTINIRKKKNFKRHTIHYGISKDFLFNLLAYYGPEFCGVINESEHDFMFQCEYKQLTQAEYQLLLPRIQHAEDCMEKFKLLYENIYANIYYTYAMCGQTMQILTLLDIEQALPIPQLVTYISQWKSAEDAFTTIVYMMQQLQQINEILGVDGMEYQFANQLFNRVKQKFNKSIQDVLHKQGLQLPDNLSISQFSDDEKVSDISENEYNIWNNHYAKQQSEPAHGGIYLVSKKDFQKQKYLFKHYDTVINDQSLIFIYVPSFTSVSQVTGNMHRLCWNNDNSNLRTTKQRMSHIVALISLARILFPSNQRIYGQYKYPFVSQWKFTPLSKIADIQRVNTKFKVKYVPDFTINIVRPKYQIKSNKILYQLAPIILPIMQSEHVQSSALQYVLTEVFVMKLVQFGHCNQKAKIFLDTIHNQYLSPFQQIQLMKIPETLENPYLKQVLQNQNFNMDHRIVQNALAVLFGSGSLDYGQVSNIKFVVDTLQRNQYYYDNQYRSYFYGYTQYMYMKIKLYMQNFICPQQKFTEMETFLNDLLAYQDQFINILKVHNQEESIINAQIYKFLSKFYEFIVKLIPLKCTHELEGDQLQLLHAIYKDDSTNYQSQTDTNFHRQYNYTGIITVYNQIHDQVHLRDYFKMYTISKLSNIVYTIEKTIMHNLMHDREEQFQNPYKYNQLIDNAQVGLRIMLTFLSTHRIQLMEEQEKSLTNKSNNSSFSISNVSNSSESSSDDDDDESEQNHNMFQQGFNIQFWDLDFISHNDIFFYAKGKENNLLMQNYEASHNTPEFVLAILNCDNERSCAEYNTFYTLVIIDLFKQLHRIKINDNSFRSLSTANYLIQNIQQKEFSIEQQIIYFLKNLIEIKKSEFNIKDTSIPQLITSLNEINFEITKMLQIYLSLLHREYLTEDHIYIIKKEMDRSIKMLYGYPNINYDQYPSDRDKLIAICEIYLGHQQSLIPIVLEQIEKLPRSGGIYHNNMTYIFQRHRTWTYKFMWEQYIKSLKEEEDKHLQMQDNFMIPNVKGMTGSLHTQVIDTRQSQNKTTKLSLDLPMNSDQRREVLEDSLTISLNMRESLTEQDQENILPSSHATSDTSKSSSSTKSVWNKIKCGMKQVKKYIIIPMIISMILTLLLGIAFMTLIIQQIQLFKSKLQIIEQTTSQELYRLGQMSSQIEISYQENPVYIIPEYLINEKLSEYQQLNNRLFKNYLLLSSYFTGKTIKQVYENELTHKTFKYELDKLQTDVLPACYVSDYFNIKEKPPHYGLRFILSSITTEPKSSYVYNYYFNNPVRVGGLEARFNYTFNNTVIQANIMEILYIYTMTMNCQSNLLMNVMYQGQNTHNITNIVLDIQKLQLQYQNVFTNAFDMLRNNYYMSIKYYTQIIIYALTVIIIFQMYFLMHHILINYQTKILIDNIDKGSTISRISKLPISKLEQLLRQYKQKISQKPRNSAQSHNIQHNVQNIHHPQFQQQLNKVIENQRIDEQFNKFWDLTTSMFKYSVHNVLLIPIFISTIFFIIGYSLIAKSIAAPIMASSINMQNQFMNISYQISHKIPYAEQFYNRSNLTNYEFASYLTETNYSSHAVYGSVDYILQWTKYFTTNELSVNNLEYFITIPLPQVDYIRLYMQVIPTYVSSNEYYQMQQILNQLGRSIITAMSHQSQNIINNDQLSETYETIMKLYNIDYYNQTFGQYFQESEIMNVIDSYLKKSTIHYDAYIGFALYAAYVIIQISCLVVLLRNIFAYMYRPYNINFNKKNKQVRAISQLLQNRFTFMFLMFIIIVNLIIIALDLVNMYIFFYFIYKSVNQFIADTANFGKMLFSRLSPLEFTLSLFTFMIIMAIYDAYAYNLLVTVCSLGKDKNTMFIPPYHVEKRKTQMNFQILKVLTAITSMIAVLIIQLYPYIVTDVINYKNFYLSQTVSYINQLGIIMQPTYNFQPNLFYTNYHNMYKAADMGIQLLEQTVQLNNIISVKPMQDIQNTLINDYIDTLWKMSIGQKNKAVLKYQEENPPSFIYGVINNSLFQTYYLPRDMKFGRQLTEDPNIQKEQPLLTLFLMYMNCAKFTTYYPNKELYNTLIQDFSLYLNTDLTVQYLSESQKSVNYITYIANSYIPQINFLINKYAEEQLFSQLQHTIKNLYIYFVVAMCLTGVFLAVIILMFLRVVYITRTFLLKNNLFTSLFLKRHFLLSAHGFSSRSSMSSKPQTDFNTHNPTTPRQAPFNDLSVHQINSINEGNDSD